MLQAIKYTLEEYWYTQVIMIIEVSENNKDDHRYNNKPFEQVSQQH